MASSDIAYPHHCFSRASARLQACLQHPTMLHGCLALRLVQSCSPALLLLCCLGLDQPSCPLQSSGQPHQCPPQELPATSGGGGLVLLLLIAKHVLHSLHASYSDADPSKLCWFDSAVYIQQGVPCKHLPNIPTNLLLCQLCCSACLPLLEICQQLVHNIYAGCQLSDIAWRCLHIAELCVVGTNTGMLVS